jgi:hypothetical protein
MPFAFGIVIANEGISTTRIGNNIYVQNLEDHYMEVIAITLHAK